MLCVLRPGVSKSCHFTLGRSDVRSEQIEAEAARGAAKTPTPGNSVADPEPDAADVCDVWALLVVLRGMLANVTYMSKLLLRFASLSGFANRCAAVGRKDWHESTLPARLVLHTGLNACWPPLVLDDWKDPWESTRLGSQIGLE